jgi:predicted DCC family thiol-disulfide oxidoreductase YuxK
MAEVIVWFDGGCPLCRREIALMRRLDRAGAIQFLDVASPDGGACPLDRAELLARFHAMENGRLVSGAEAFAAMWRAIPPLRALGFLARNPLALRVLETGYRAFLRVRPRLQRFVARLDERSRVSPG